MKTKKICDIRNLEKDDFHQVLKNLYSLNSLMEALIFFIFNGINNINQFSKDFVILTVIGLSTIFESLSIASTYQWLLPGLIFNSSFPCSTARLLVFGFRNKETVGIVEVFLLICTTGI